MTISRNPAPDARTAIYFFASSNGANTAWLAQALQASGKVVPVTLDKSVLDERIAALNPQAVFLDFANGQSADISAVHDHLAREWPLLPIVGAGSAADPGIMLSALRAGVDDFVDIGASAQDVSATLVALLERRTMQHANTRGRTVALLGARAGIGVTTLATNLALLLQELVSRTTAGLAAHAQRGVALLDLGLPARDGLMYLDTQSSFNFVDGVQSIRRLDLTLVQTALAHHVSGTVVLPLPHSLSQMREISHADSAALVKRLGDFFEFQIADLGGFSTLDFIANAVQEADKIWVVCDQSIGAIVSTATLLRDLQARGLEAGRFALVVNQMDAGVSLTAKDIAARLGLPLQHVLPARRAALLSAANRGEVLARANRNDSYAQAVLAMAKALHSEYSTSANLQVAPSSRWSQLTAHFTGKRGSA